MAEGFDSETNQESVHFLWYAKQSCTQVSNRVYVALNQQCITNAEFHNPER
ncbi:MAG: four helix bundle protein [Deltaproteobacteria bacterium]|nr:four helix bundle protein [Deltaproteobacteria bacterium]